MQVPKHWQIPTCWQEVTIPDGSHYDILNVLFFARKKKNIYIYIHIFSIKVSFFPSKETVKFPGRKISMVKVFTESSWGILPIFKFLVKLAPWIHICFGKKFSLLFTSSSAGRIPTTYWFTFIHSSPKASKNRIHNILWKGTYIKF